MKRIPASQLRTIQKMLRVNQAGEIGANYIYKGQLRVLGEEDSTIKHMWDQEKRHLKILDEMLPKNRTRPSALRPIWEMAGYVLGVGTAIMGRKAAMACTEAVETVIGNHYNDQLRKLLEIQSEIPELEKVEEFQYLLTKIKEFRDEELEHLDTAVEQDAHKAPLYPILTNFIKFGCRAAIKVAEKI